MSRDVIAALVVFGRRLKGLPILAPLGSAVAELAEEWQRERDRLERQRRGSTGGDD